MEVAVVYNAAPCNVTPGCFVVYSGRYVLYASGPTIVACELHAESVDDCISRNVGTFYCHTDLVNQISWVSGDKQQEESLLLTTSNDKTASLWRVSQDDAICKLTQLCKLTGHTDGVTYGCAQQRCDLVVVCTISLDSTVRIWSASVAQGLAKCIQTLKFGNGFALCATLTLLQSKAEMTSETANRYAMLALASDDNSIRLYSANLNNLQNQSQSDSENKSHFCEVYTLKAHEEWVRSLAFSHDGEALFLASGGQDSYIRIWKFTELEPTSEQLKLRSRSTVKVDTKLAYCVKLDSLLTAHSDRVYSCHFIQQQNSSPTSSRMISCSLDKSVLIWEREQYGWFEAVRLGRIGGGDNVLGYIEARYVSLGSEQQHQLVIACDYSGALHCWKCVPATGWLHLPIATSHYRAVNDLCWSPFGDLLFTISDDQTSRIHAPIADVQSRSVWLEIGRPQVHGYNLRCVAVLDSHLFVSGSLDEKVLRAFCATRQFIDDYERLVERPLRFANDELRESIVSALPLSANVPALGLTNKAVFNYTTDLQQEASTATDRMPEEEEEVAAFSSEPPPVSLLRDVNTGSGRRIRAEDDLIDATLWPELSKLYGHPNDISALDACRVSGLLKKDSGDVSEYFIASACSAKVSRSEDAQIIIWRVRDFLNARPFESRFELTLVQRLSFHKSTVLQLRFSNCRANTELSGSSTRPLRLLSVSLDRSFAIFELRRVEKNSPEGLDYEFVRVASSLDQGIVQVHNRVIWGCAWSPDDAYFATISRDRVLGVWSLDSDGSKLQSLLVLRENELSDVPTSIDFAPKLVPRSNEYLLAVGFEKGLVQLLGWSPNAGNAQILWSSTDKQLHCASVNRLQFKPSWSCGKERNDEFLLATCSSDSTVKCLRISRAAAE